MKALIASAFAFGLLAASATSADALTIHIGGGHHWHGHYYHGGYYHHGCRYWGWHHGHRWCRGWW
ncbi:MAG TPA: hypothetical protein VMU08_18190 [Rhizomicrobium sp.]|nr:hypothetical protein [Rhizomicrobium sp.]